MTFLTRKQIEDLETLTNIAYESFSGLPEPDKACAIERGISGITLDVQTHFHDNEDFMDQLKKTIDDTLHDLATKYKER